LKIEKPGISRAFCLLLIEKSATHFIGSRQKMQKPAFSWLGRFYMGNKKAVGKSNGFFVF
jgi:hypothetical protein